MKIMKPNLISQPATASASRRNFIQRLGLGAALFAMPGAFAEELTRKKVIAKTAQVEEGPFYPPKLPLDTDNDLILVNDALTPAIGEITHLSGRLLNASGGPIRNATIEIWSVDHDGIYLADRGNQTKFDANFQGFGRFLTSSTGEYYFRTLKPVRFRDGLRRTSISKSKPRAASHGRRSFSSRAIPATRRTASIRTSATTQRAIP